MSQPTTFAGAHVAIFLESLQVAGTFIRPCGLNDHQLSFSKNTNTVTVPDCDDPDLPAWTERETESLDFSGSASGILAAEAVDDWWAAYANTSSINSRIYIGKPDNVTNGRFWSGKLHVTQFDVTGARGNKAEISVAVESDGELVYAPVTA